MLEEQRDVVIHWPDEFDEAKRAELRGVVLAYNDALTELEAGPAAVFASDGERNGVFHGFLKLWDKAWSKPGPCMHMGCTSTSIPRSHTISLGTSIRLIAEKGHVLTPRYGEDGIDLIDIGVRDASTFPGFCDAHEQLFSGFESQKAMTQADHFRLQIFRTICREIHSKRHQRQKAEAMLAEYWRRRDAYILQKINAAAGGPQAFDVSGLKFENDEMETKLVNHLAGIQADLPELEGLYASVLDEIQNGGDKAAMTVINFDFQLPVCLSGFGVLNYRETAAGPVQRAMCMLAILPEEGCTKLLLAAAKEHERAIGLHASDRRDLTFGWLIALDRGRRSSTHSISR
ncbi:hypothetical protein [Croceicoccus mobilis]|uniref:Uncharacterized protein n=1 Tax=Croceicoccus mobilis TaxID=1703339 RepID=A0A916Z9S5_9SPHN|nr:hypothetical protein [Croceicoccus mobilis]GGD83230.1 hypothetical protein GCM10010990_36640 [Croceicoccus mobilis]